MKKRVYICGNFPFPRAGATSNYVQYLSLALNNVGFETHVVSLLPTGKTEMNCYKGIYTHFFNYGCNRISRYFGFQKGGISSVLCILDKEKVNSDDLVICYSSRPFFVKELSKWCKKRSIKHGACIVELFGRENFSGRFAGFEYRKYAKMNSKYYPMYDFLFPISTYIEDYFSSYSVKQLRLPIMADTSEYKSEEKRVSDVRRFIFPANGKMKDALENMIEAIEKALTMFSGSIEFHFCGIKRTDIERHITNKSLLQDGRIIVHDWMDYRDLISLYQKVDFLLLARSDCQMTRANFPSKVPEVMMYGVIPIVSAVGDYTKIYLKDMENAIVINGCEPDEIYSAICRAVNLPNKEIERLSAEARRLVQEQLDYTKWTETISQFLKLV